MMNRLGAGIEKMQGFVPLCVLACAVAEALC